MRSLQSQIGLCARAQWILASGMLVFLVSFYLLGYRPHSQHLGGLQAQMQAKQRELDTDRSRASTLPIVEFEVEKLRLKLQRFDKKLPKDPQLGQFLESLARLREQYSLRNWNYQPGVPKRTELFSELPIQINFEGDFLNACTFLRQTEEMQRLTRVRSISIRSKDGKLGQVEVQMAMNIYFAEG